MVTEKMSKITVCCWRCGFTDTAEINDESCYLVCPECGGCAWYDLASMFDPKRTNEMAPDILFALSRDIYTEFIVCSLRYDSVGQRYYHLLGEFIIREMLNRQLDERIEESIIAGEKQVQAMIEEHFPVQPLIEQLQAQLPPGMRTLKIIPILKRQNSLPGHKKTDKDENRESEPHGGMYI